MAEPLNHGPRAIDQAKQPFLVALGAGRLLWDGGALARASGDPTVLAFGARRRRGSRAGSRGWRRYWGWGGRRRRRGRGRWHRRWRRVRRASPGPDRPWCDVSTSAGSVLELHAARCVRRRRLHALPDDRPIAARHGMPQSRRWVPRQRADLGPVRTGLARTGKRAVGPGAGLRGGTRLRRLCRHDRRIQQSARERIGGGIEGMAVMGVGAGRDRIRISML